ncbi:TolC family protein [Flavobacterium gawalongense]|uniref:TolC family protein n=1 Tax=Flavobacterium gawalongense TaxID=2594432 RepID=A0A553BFC6_9FLAO|nr:TolC family protein [Flavobacterium gawalongense]TRW99860.1 TolC family protein [Flavobacterium gawalongense]TRX04330.1 TolC family protein [Flavobacterium gawalongense]TRX06951.1 TolC family protein [Flavobacterium gawalongense]TRX07919.1 TolC family protein [Flavobacterium gawalongense]TRX24168.1 TolC family protein [Flavobacterium gawalongense]
MTHSKILFQSLILLLFCIAKTNAQEVLTLESAIKIALENNYEIKIATNNLDIEKTNVAIGNAGMLPKVTATIVDNNSVQNSSQTRQDGTETELDNAKNNSLSYGVGLDWTIFDGLRMFARLDQLKELQKLGEAQLKLTVITKISDVHAAYYDLVQQQQQLAALDTTIVISNQRLALAQNRFTIGKASKLEVLNAQVDLNTDQVAVLRQKELYANSKILLNQILARDLKSDFKVIDFIAVDNQLLLPELTALAEKQNPQLETQIINKKVAELELKQIKAGRYPTIRVNTGYNFSESQSSLGFVSQSASKGLNYGFSASLNVFDGFAQNRNEKITKIQIENSKMTIEQQNLTLHSQLATSYQTYLTNLELIALEEKNESIAKQNLNITLDKFRIGTITTLEFRTAQLNYVNAKVRYSNAQFLGKLSEIALRELAGNLNF